MIDLNCSLLTVFDEVTDKKKASYRSTLRWIKTWRERKDTNIFFNERFSRPEEEKEEEELTTKVANITPLITNHREIKLIILQPFDEVN